MDFLFVSLGMEEMEIGLVTPLKFFSAGKCSWLGVHWDQMGVGRLSRMSMLWVKSAKYCSKWC